MPRAPRVEHDWQDRRAGPDPSFERVLFGRIDAIESRLARIEGGLALAAFVVPTAILLLSALRVWG